MRSICNYIATNTVFKLPKQNPNGHIG